MDKYYVTFRSMLKWGSRRVNQYFADSFAHVEEQAKQDLEPNEDIISIDKNYSHG